MKTVPLSMVLIWIKLILEILLCYIWIYFSQKSNTRIVDYFYLISLKNLCHLANMPIYQPSCPSVIMSINSSSLLCQLQAFSVAKVSIYLYATMSVSHHAYPSIKIPRFQNCSPSFSTFFATFKLFSFLVLFCFYIDVVNNLINFNFCSMLLNATFLEVVYKREIVYNVTLFRI